MFSSRKSLQVQVAIGDGNCAFNAFALGFCSPEVLEQIEAHLKKMGKDPSIEFSIFIEAVSHELEVDSNWAAVKKALLELAQSNNSGYLQETLASIMRGLAIQMAEKDKQHIHRTKQPLISAYRDFAYKQLGIEMVGVADDIYRRHEFITEKFEELVLPALESLIDDQSIERNLEKYKSLKTKDNINATEQKEFSELEAQLDTFFNEMQKRLLTWWKKEGYQQFLDEMKKEGKWAGDLELSKLAQYFGVNLDVHRGGFSHHIYFDHGSLPLVSADAIKQLSDRNIIDRPEQGAKHLRMLSLQKTEVTALLNRIPDYETVAEHIYAHIGNLKQTPVPAGLSDASIQQLIARDVAQKKSDGQVVFNLEADDALDRIEAVQDHEKILTAWDENHVELPVVSLSNEHGLHWNNLVSAVAEKKADAVVSTLKEDLLKELKSGNIAPDETAWKRLIGRARREAARPSFVMFANYELPSGEVLKVNEQTQIDLDDQLAKKLQHEEYENYLKCK